MLKHFPPFFCPAVYGSHFQEICLRLWTNTGNTSSGFETKMKPNQRTASERTQSAQSATDQRQKWQRRKMMFRRHEESIHHHNFTDWSINIFGLWVLSALINAKHYRFLAFLMGQQLWWYQQKFPFLWQPLVFLGVCNSSPIYWLSLNISFDSTVNRMKYGNIITVLFARTVGKSSSESSKVNTMI